MTYATVEREDAPVLYTSRRDSLPRAAQEAFAELEAKLGTLRGRRFYGVFDAAADEYRACVESKPEDDAATLGLSEGTIPGGRYAKEILRGDPPGVYAEIQPGFEALAAAFTPDSTRPWVEFYRRHDEVVLLLPIRD